MALNDPNLLKEISERLGYEVSLETKEEDREKNGTIEKETQYCIKVKADKGNEYTYQIQEKADGTQEIVLKAINDITHKLHIPGDEATCTEAQTCKYCSEVIYTPALGHIMGEWTTEIAPTCEVEGKKTRRCQRIVNNVQCNYRETGSIDPLGHNYASEYTIDVQPTCTKKGSESRHCTREGCSSTTGARDINAKGHQFGELKIINATCEEDGQESRTCKVCGYKEINTKKANGHDWGEWKETTAATCKDNGVKTRTCKVCSKTETQPIPKNDSHKWGNWTVTTKPTCQTAEVDTRTCSVCSKKETQTKGKGDHSWAIDKSLNRYTGHYYKCSTPNCTATKALEAHIWPTYLNGKQWNQYESGNQYLYKLHYHDCSVCGYRITGNHTDRTATISYANKDNTYHFKYYKCPDCLIIYKTEQEYHSTTGFTYKWNNNKSSPKHTKKCKASGCTYSGTESCNSSNPCMKKGAPIYNQVCSKCGYCKTCKKAH